MRASPVSRRIRSRPRNAWMRCRRGCGSYAGASRSSSTTTRPWRSSSGTSTWFQDFLASYPSSPLAENAQYWLGEAYYVNHDYESAAGAFRAVLKKWPDSRKAPDALLKLGYTQYAQKQYPAARATLTEVLRKYPGSDSAKHAAERLRRFSGAGSQ